MMDDDDVEEETQSVSFEVQQEKIEILQKRLAQNSKKTVLTATW